MYLLPGLWPAAIQDSRQRAPATAHAPIIQIHLCMTPPPVYPRTSAAGERFYSATRDLSRCDRHPDFCLIAATRRNQGNGWQNERNRSKKCDKDCVTPRRRV
jgi:hypothetical protein